MTGLPYAIRVAGYGLRAPKTPVPGMDVVGVVEAVGDSVTRFRLGDEVFGIGKVAFADFATASEHKLAPKPANVTFEQAAVVPVSGRTALQALRDHAEIDAGQRVLIVGASGGVGTYAVQLAKLFGAHVTAVCTTSKVDIGGNPSLSRLRRVLAPTGTPVIAGGETGAGGSAGSERQVRALVLSRFVDHNCESAARSSEVYSRCLEAHGTHLFFLRVYRILQKRRKAVQHESCGEDEGGLLR